MQTFVVLRTHGGLGNQLFQILFGRLYAEAHGIVLREVHDARYPHGFARSEALKRGGSPSMWQSIVSAARVPKVLERVFGRNEGAWRFGRSVYLDGYFQSAAVFGQFAAARVGAHLDALADELAIGQAELDICLVHLRVGDFFVDKKAAHAHVLERLTEVPTGAHVMTNDECLLSYPDIAAALAARGAVIVGTAGMPAEDVLRTMARYRRIDANDSTLTLWASVLANSQVRLRDARLRECRDFLLGQRRGVLGGAQ